MAGRYPTHDDFRTLVEGLRAAGASVAVEDIQAAAPGDQCRQTSRAADGAEAGGAHSRASRLLYALTPRLMSESLDPLADAYDERRERDRTKLEQMVVYAQTSLCPHAHAARRAGRGSRVDRVRHLRQLSGFGDPRAGSR